jgi:hypothetical protein
MQRAPDVSQESREDLFYGQVVIIMARWFLILDGVVLALWQAETIAAITLPIGFMILLMVVNFYLHGRYLLRRPVNSILVYATSGVDLLIIVLIVLFWSIGRGGGAESPFFAFLYPAVLAFALVFPPRITATYAGVALAAYVLAVLLGSGIGDLAAQKDLLMRVVTLGATAGLGTYFWRIQRRRRSTPDRAHAALLHDVELFTSQPGGMR